MLNETSDINQFRGAHYEFSVKQGELLKESPLMKKREKIYSRLAQKFIVDLSAVEGLLHKFAPGIHAKMQDLADVLHLDLAAAYLHFGG